MDQKYLSIDFDSWSKLSGLLMADRKLVKKIQVSHATAKRGVAVQSCKSGRAFRVGFGLKVDKILGIIRARDGLFVLGAQKYNQNNLATLLNFSHLI